jgi:cytochrome d ubiquinol oxidase subunit II
MFLILAALIVRPVAFKYRSKRDSATWRAAWDWALFVGGFVPSLIFGVALGNVLQGVPFRFDGDLRIFYEGSFFGLLNPFALLCGLLSVSMLIMHGSAWLQLKTTGIIAERARRFGSFAAPITLLLFALAGLILWTMIGGYRITSIINPVGPSNPLLKTVVQDNNAWFANFVTHSWMIIAPALGFLGAMIALLGFRSKREITTILSSALSIFGIISTVGLSMFPFILPSSIDPRSSLTVWDTSSSHLTLFIMLVVTVIFVPLITAYTTWVYRVLWGKVDDKTISNKSGHAY